MSILERFLGLIFAPAYALRRSKLGFLRLHIGAMLLCLLGATYVTYRGWRDGFTLAQAALIVFLLVLVGLLLWADAQRYVVFRPRPVVASEEAMELAPEQKLFLRGTGFFEVNEMRRYLVDVPVVFWPTQLAEHILAAKVRAFNFLGIGVPSGERGWWYIFLEPPHVVDITPGELCFGFRLRPAVRVLFKTPKGREVVYLSCNDSEQLAIVLGELQAKVEAARDRRRQQNIGEGR